MSLNANHLSDSELTIGTTEHLGRFRGLKRFLARLLLPFFGYQVHLNRSFAEDLLSLEGQLLRLEQALEGHEKAEDLSSLQGQFLRLEQALKGHERTLASAGQSIEDLFSRWQLVEGKIDLAQRQSFARYHEGVASLREEINELLAQLAELPHEAEVAEISRNVANEVASEMSERFSDALDKVARLGSDMNEGLSDALDKVARLGSDMNEGLSDALDKVARLGSDMNEANARARRALGEVRSRLSQYDLLLDTVRRNLPKPIASEQLAASSPNALDVVYEALEESFRGTRDEIIERVRPYCDDVLSCVPQGPVLDVGCGRGELLEVLASAGVEAYGIDTNPVIVDKVRARGLDARLVDARAHLASLEPESLRAVTALHLVEHLDTQDVLLLLDAAFRVLRHGGLLILETPNPQNVIVGSSSFYLDPTHRAPLPPALLAFLVESRGFSDVDIRYPARQDRPQLCLPNDQEPPGGALRPVVDALNEYLFAPPDYTVIATRL